MKKWTATVGPTAANQATITVSRDATTTLPAFSYTKTTYITSVSGIDDFVVKAKAEWERVQLAWAAAHQSSDGAAEVLDELINK